MGAEAIHQFTSFARKGDAVYDHAAELRKVFLSWGKRSTIYVLDRNHPPIDGVEHYKRCRPGPEDILVCHFGIGSKFTNFILSKRSRKFLVYHNMTPGTFLIGVDNQSYLGVLRGRKELDRLKDALDGVMADSTYNARDLELRHGYKNVVVAPILKSFSDYAGREPDPALVEKWRGDKKTILFIGRIMANKRQNDLIHALHAYTRLYGRGARLVIPGSWKNTEGYRDDLKKLIGTLGLDDLVEMPGFIDDDDFYALFSVADVYLSLSEHEGFGVPFLEAMYFGVPVMAYGVCSIPEVLGSAGIKLNRKDPVVIATALKDLFENDTMRDRIVAAQKERLKSFSRDKIEPLIKEIMAAYL